MDKYLDPPNVTEIIEQIKTLPTIGDIKLLADELFPGWWCSTIQEYSSDYPDLDKNWKSVCVSIGVKKALIVLVDFLEFTDNHILLKMFAESFTRAGFNVRKNSDYITCSNCKGAIPCELIWSIFKEKNFNVPLKWSQTCQNCIN
jgi:hypothetical protein